MTYIAFFSYVPSLIILMGSPFIVPSKIGYKTFMSIIIFMFGLGIFLTPFYRDLITKDNYNFVKKFIYIN